MIAIGPTFASLLGESFDEIGSAGGSVAILLRMLGALQTIASLTDNPSRRQVLREQVAPHDRARFESRLAQVREALESSTIHAQ